MGIRKTSKVLCLLALLVPAMVFAAPGLEPTAFDYRRIHYEQTDFSVQVQSGLINYFLTGATSGEFDQSFSNAIANVSQNSFAPDTVVNYGPVFLQGTGSADAVPLEAIPENEGVYNRTESIYEASFTPTETFSGTLSGTLTSYSSWTDDPLEQPRHVTVKLYENDPFSAPPIWSFEAPLTTGNAGSDFSYNGTFDAAQQYVLTIEAKAHQALAGFLDSYPVGTGGSWDFTFELDVPVVAIDVLPGDSANQVYPNQAGKLPVAVLSAADFDATQVDPSTLRFGSAEATATGAATISDVDGQFGNDTTTRFKVEESGIFCNDTEVTLSGSTYAGDLFTGTDVIDATECETGGCHAY